MIKESFVLRVLAVLFIFLALPLLIACFVMFQKDYEAAIDEAKRVLQTSASVRTSSIYHVKPFSSNFVGQINYFLDLKNRMPHEIDKTLTESLKKISDTGNNLVTISVLGPPKEGGVHPILASSQDDLLGKTFVSYDHLPSIAKGGRDEFVRTVFSKELQKYSFNIYVAQAILSENDTLLGYLLINANIDSELGRIIQLGREVHSDDYYAVVQEDGVVVMANDSALSGSYFTEMSSEKKQKFFTETHQTPSDACLDNAPLSSNTVATSPNFLEFQFRKDVQLAYLPPPSKYGVSVMAYSSKQLVFNKAMKRFLFIYIGYGALLIIGGVVSYVLSVMMSKPLRKLADLMKKVEEGDLSHRFQDEKLGYEINALGNIFNQTLDTLLDNIQKEETYRITKETYQKELEIGYEVQRRLLPEKMPDMKEVEIASVYLPSEVAGGDFYDFIEKDGKLFIVLGDAASKGISPCLYALVVRSLVRGYTGIREDVGKILVSTNDLFCADVGETGMYVTLFMGSIDVKKKVFSYYSCGHPPAILRKSSGHVELLEHRGMALGIREGTNFEKVDVQLESGDLLLFYTDGFVHASNERHQYFSRDRILDCLQHRDWKTANEVIDGLTQEVKEFIGGAKQEGEITIVAMRII